MTTTIQKIFRQIRQREFKAYNTHHFIFVITKIEVFNLLEDESHSFGLPPCGATSHSLRFRYSQRKSFLDSETRYRRRGRLLCFWWSEKQNGYSIDNKATQKERFLTAPNIFLAFLISKASKWGREALREWCFAQWRACKDDRCQRQSHPLEACHSLERLRS